METVHRKPRIIPVCKQFRQDSVACNSPEEVFRLFKDSASFMLESAYGEDKRAKYSLIGLHPVMRVTAAEEGRTNISGLSEYIQAILPLFAHDAFISAAHDTPENGILRTGSTPVRADCSLDPSDTPDDMPLCSMETITITKQDPVSIIHRIPSTGRPPHRPARA